MPNPGAAPRTPGALLRDRWGFFAVLGIFAVFSLLVLIPKYPPLLYDYPDWVYQGVLLRDTLQGHPDPGYTLKPYPVPFSALIYFIGVTSLVLPWMLAAKLLWVLNAALDIFAVSYLMKTLGRRDQLVWLIVPTFVLINQTWWWGAGGFLLGLPLDILGVSLFLRRKMDAVYLVPLTVAAFFVHGQHLLALGMLIALETVRARRIPPLLSLIPAALLSAAYIYGRYAVLHNAEQMHFEGVIPMLSPLFPLFKVNGLVKSMGFANPLGVGGPVLARWFGPWGLAALEMLAAIAVACAWVLLIARARRAWTGPVENPREPWVWGLLALWSVLFLICPSTFLGGADFGQRLLEMVLAIGLCIAFRPTLAGKLLCAISMIFLCLNLVLIAAISNDPAPAGASARVLGPLARFSAMSQAQRWSYYKAIENKRMTVTVFPTALFLKNP